MFGNSSNRGNDFTVPREETVIHVGISNIICFVEVPTTWNRLFLRYAVYITAEETVVQLFRPNA